MICNINYRRDGLKRDNKKESMKEKNVKYRERIKRSSLRYC